ncbi:MAG: hypothetical protein HXS46_06625 [Theionarchaea archaeon]|nr:MAG: hypothetical protein AYK18_12925 [Theionarchaea archaeon DG-70]MBU7010348.1 hypothetical protein [Theionarchaea archaeon]
MEEMMIFEIEDFIQKARERSPVHTEESFDARTFRNYLRFSNLEEHKDYYQQIKVCKTILNDIRNQSSYLSKMEQYCPEIGSVSIEDIEKIRYNAEEESYVIYADGSRHEIYEDDIRFIYPSIVDIPDSFEYEVVLEDSSVYVYNKFTADPPFRVFGVAEAAEE